MNVLHVTPYYAPAWAFGGVVQAVTGLAEAQAALGHQVTVLTTDVLDRTHRIPLPEEELGGVRVIRQANLLPALRRHVNLATPLHFGRALDRLLTHSSFDLIHCHELRTVENLAAVARARRAGIPLVVSPHGTLPHQTGRGYLKWAWDAVFGGRWMRSFDLVVCLTAREAQQASELWRRMGAPLPSGKIVVIPNGVTASPPPSPEAQGAFRAHWGLGTGPVILYLGRLAPRKGLPLLIASLDALTADLPDVRLLVVGPDEGARKDLVRRVRRSGQEARVVLTGLLTGRDRLLALASADVMVLPSTGEGMPMAGLEALASGVPLVLTEGDSLEEAVAAGAAMVCAADAGSLAQGLLSLLADEARRAAMGARGRSLASSRYAWSRIADAMDEAYRAVLAS